MIANQPVVIDNVSVGGRESRCREGRGGQPTAIPLSSGAAAPRPPPPPTRLGRRLRPSPSAVRCLLGRGGASTVKQPAIGWDGRLSPPEGRCPSLMGSGPRRRRGVCGL